MRYDLKKGWATRCSRPGTRAKKSGLTLIEVMIVVLIIAVAVLGAMGFRFYSITDAKRADVQSNAARIGSMFLENWKGLGGYTDASHITIFENVIINSCPQYSITKVLTGPAKQTGFTALTDRYQVRDTANNVYYYITLSYMDATATTPEALNAAIAWRAKYDAGSVTTSDHAIHITTYQE